MKQSGIRQRNCYNVAVPKSGMNVWLRQRSAGLVKPCLGTRSVRLIISLLAWCYNVLPMRDRRSENQRHPSSSSRATVMVMWNGPITDHRSQIGQTVGEWIDWQHVALTGMVVVVRHEKRLTSRSGQKLPE